MAAGPPGMTVAPAVRAGRSGPIEVHEFAHPRGEADAALVRLSDDLVPEEHQDAGSTHRRLSRPYPGHPHVEAGHGRAHRQAHSVTYPLEDASASVARLPEATVTLPACTSHQTVGPPMNLTCNGGALG